MSDIKFEIKEELGVLSENAKGWRKEVNLISWNGAAPKYDIAIGRRTMRRWEKGSPCPRRRREGLKKF